MTGLAVGTIRSDWWAGGGGPGAAAWLQNRTSLPTLRLPRCEQQSSSSGAWQARQGVVDWDGIHDPTLSREDFSGKRYSIPGIEPQPRKSNPLLYLKTLACAMQNIKREKRGIIQTSGLGQGCERRLCLDAGIRSGKEDRGHSLHDEVVVCGA
jgi:hypothetical protein